MKWHGNTHVGQTARLKLNSHNRQPLPCEYESEKESGGQSVLMHQRLVDKAL